MDKDAKESKWYTYKTKCVSWVPIILDSLRQVLHTPGPEMYPGMCTYCFTLKKAHLIICPVFIRASNFGTRSMKYEAK